jgi:hypothetical protein
MTNHTEILQQAGITLNGPKPTDIQIAAGHSVEELFETQLSFGESYMDGVWTTQDLPGLLCLVHQRI